MTKCDLEIVLDDPERVYRPGDKVRGQVLVVVNDECRCDELTLRSHWRTHGRGNRTGGKGVRIDLHQGLWIPGEEHAYPFEIEVPPGPFTYHGHLINVDWYLEARADIPWALDPKCEIEFFLELGEGGEFDSADEKEQLYVDLMGNKLGLTTLMDAFRSRWLPGLMLSALVLIGTISILLGQVGKMVGILLWAVPVGIGVVFIVFHLLRNRLARRKLGNVEFSIDPARLRASEGFRAQVRFEPQQLLRLKGIELCLLGREVVVVGLGTRRRILTHTLYEEKIELLEGEGSLFPGRQVEYEKNVQVPAGAAPSFCLTDNRVEWWVQLKVDIPGWPDYVERRTIWVVT